MHISDLFNDLDEAKEVKQRLDPKCWTGYRRVGTKMKGGVRVNDCRKVTESMYDYKGFTYDPWYDYEDDNKKLWHDVRDPQGKVLRDNPFDKDFKVFGPYGRRATRAEFQQYIDSISNGEHDVTEDQRENRISDPLIKQMVAKARNAHPDITSDEEAMALYLHDKENFDVSRLEQEESNLESKLSKLQQQINDLKTLVQQVSSKNKSEGPDSIK